MGARITIWALCLTASLSSAVCAASLVADSPDAQTLDLGNTALLHPLEGISVEAKRDFFIGKSFFHSNWVIAPATTTARAGLGPYFNARACGGCHLGNSRGKLPDGDRLESPGALVIRLSLPRIDAHGAPVPEPTYGTELSAFAIPGVAPEGKIRVTYVAVPGHYADGEAYTLRKPDIAITDFAQGPLAPGTQIAPRFAPPIPAVGLLAAIDDKEIEEEARRQGGSPGPIKGQVNRVWNPLTSRMELGRFGWKANVASLVQQTVAAFLTDIGITSRFAPSQNCSSVETDCLSAPAGKSPEIDDATLSRVITYISLLSAPPRSPPTLTAQRGEVLFERFGCAGCHKPAYHVAATTLPTVEGLTPVALPETLRGTPVRAFSDLLLHDMGAELADSRKEFLASERQWRTPPLWGIGLTARITSGEAYLHDGRARSLAEAVLWHGGEAETAREAFRIAKAKDRGALLDFLRSL